MTNNMSSCGPTHHMVKLNRMSLVESKKNIHMCQN